MPPSNTSMRMPHAPHPQVLTPGRPPLAAPQGRWPAAWSLVCTILRAGRGDAAASAEDSSEEELQMRLCELHSTIFLQVGGQCLGAVLGGSCVDQPRQFRTFPLCTDCTGCLLPVHARTPWNGSQAGLAGLCTGCADCHLYAAKLPCPHPVSPMRRLRRRCAPSGPPWSRPQTPGRGEMRRIHSCAALKLAVCGSGLAVQGMHCNASTRCLV